MAKMVFRCLLGATHAEETSARLHPQLSTVNCQLSTDLIAAYFDKFANIKVDPNPFFRIT